ncbi:hypothetical protein TTRE_0000864401 [Trichuris trichiura]|uniref:Abnormal cell migration protein 18-like fibronectin type I domain-containing protein n=1 Tax=Trichuris trichiura TaxID=36087 RepID=A0A077ZKJ4_TRITR|nr:hypothetical protein TTRE_0000864401 [Trichuris trichiura]
MGSVVSFMITAGSLLDILDPLKAPMLARRKRSIREDDNCPNFSNVRLMWNYVNNTKSDPFGCILESGEAIPFGATYKTKAYVLRCDQTGDEQVTMTPIQCVMNDKVIEVGQQIRYKGFVISCVNSGPCIRKKITGCVTYNGTIVQTGDTFVRDDFVFECAIADGPQKRKVSARKPIACLIDGKRVDPDNTITSGVYWLKCIRIGEYSLRKEIIGCVTEDGKLIDISQTFRTQDYLYQCKAEGYFIKIVPIGCIAKEYGIEGEFRFGEKWYTHSSGPLSYLMKCVRKKGKAERRVSRCVVNDNTDHDRKTLKPGCGIKYADDKIFVCQRLEGGIVKGSLHDYDDSKSVYEAMKPFGVRIC